MSTRALPETCPAPCNTPEDCREEDGCLLGYAVADARYTLAEARDELARRECATHGHDWRVIERMGAGPTAITCERCGETHGVVNRKADTSQAARGAVT